MKLKQIGSNMTELHLSDINRTIVLFSYETPVAACTDSIPGTWVRTEQFHSAATSKHINKWLQDLNVLDVTAARPQDYFDRLVNGL